MKPAQPGSSEARGSGARATSIPATDDAAPSNVPALANPAKAKADAGHVRSKARPSAVAVAPSLAKVAAGEPAPLAADPKHPDGEPAAAKPRVRLVDEGSPVRLLE
ncbi:MAG: hypothetical protein WDO74_28000 [Pseudomonadota bacterium]